MPLMRWWKKKKKIVLVTQKNSEVDDPSKNDVFTYGCESNILQLLKLPDGTVKVLVEGINRVKITDYNDNKDFITCSFEKVSDQFNKDEDLMPAAISAVKKLEKLTSINKKISSETINNIKALKDPSKIADNISSHLNTSISEKQQIFETQDVKKRLNLIIKMNVKFDYIIVCVVTGSTQAGMIVGFAEDDRASQVIGIDASGTPDKVKKQVREIVDNTAAFVVPATDENLKMMESILDS